MNIIDLVSGQYRKASNAKGGEYHGACPFCGDGGKGQNSDRFHIWPDQGNYGTYWCRMCGKAGDAITYLREHDGLTYRDACSRLGVDPAVTAIKPASPRHQEFIPPSSTPPPAVWFEKALKVVEYCHDRLFDPTSAGIVAWLGARGIGEDMVKKYRLGWNPTHVWRERPSWGLPPEKKEDGKLKKLWIPRGLVIPAIHNGQVIRLRIRQPEGSPRYFVVPGSSREPLVSSPADAMLIVESELDAIMLDGLAGDVVGVVAMGNDAAKPTATLYPILQQASHISVCLDSDTPKLNEITGKWEAAGARSSRWWLQQFRQAVRIPPLDGKDPGDAYANGGDIRTWVLAGLPVYHQVKAEMADHGQSRPSAPSAPAKPEQIEPPAPALADHIDPPAAEQQQDIDQMVELADGTIFHITSNQDRWNAMVADGKIVFSRNEYARLLTSMENLDADQRIKMLLATIMTKQTFLGAYVRDGRPYSDPVESVEDKK